MYNQPGERNTRLNLSVVLDSLFTFIHICLLEVAVCREDKREEEKKEEKKEKQDEGGERKGLKAMKNKRRGETRERFGGGEKGEEGERGRRG